MTHGNMLAAVEGYADEDEEGSDTTAGWVMPCFCSSVYGKLAQAQRSAVASAPPPCLRRLHRCLASQLNHEDWDGAVETIFAIQHSLLVVGTIVAEHARRQRRTRAALVPLN